MDSDRNERECTSGRCADKGLFPDWEECYACAKERIAALERKLAQAEAALAEMRRDKDVAEVERDTVCDERDEIEQRIADLLLPVDRGHRGISPVWDELRRLYHLEARYAPRDGDARPTEALRSALAEREGKHG
jgi:chromosome segregation ATPase